jgi:hypothetical protein
MGDFLQRYDEGGAERDEGDEDYYYQSFLDFMNNRDVGPTPRDVRVFFTKICIGGEQPESMLATRNKQKELRDQKIRINRINNDLRRLRTRIAGTKQSIVISEQNLARSKNHLNNMPRNAAVAEFRAAEAALNADSQAVRDGRARLTETLRREVRLADDFEAARAAYEGMVDQFAGVLSVADHNLLKLTFNTLELKPEVLAMEKEDLVEQPGRQWADDDETAQLQLADYAAEFWPKAQKVLESSFASKKSKYGAGNNVIGSSTTNANMYRIRNDEANVLNAIFSAKDQLKGMESDDVDNATFKMNFAFNLSRVGDRVNRDIPLIVEMENANQVTRAGYDPLGWARAFGLPTSEIGKQIVFEWLDSGRRSLTAGDLRSMFLPEKLPAADASSYDDFLTSEMKRERAKNLIEDMVRREQFKAGRKGDDDDDLFDEPLEVDFEGDEEDE